MNHLYKADHLIAERVGVGDIKWAVFFVRRGSFEFSRAYGKAQIHTPFLLGSPSKPITASAVMLLRDRGELSLSDPVVRFLPQFVGEGRERVTVWHLLTHTSGLPDMLPENAALRARHAPLSEFVAQTCRTPLLFEPGARVSYQSMGNLLAAAIVEKITSVPLPAFLKRNVFDPLGMKDTAVGTGGRNLADFAQMQVDEPSDWDWNSAYWRNIGAPWGGVHSNATDLATFIERFAASDTSPWKPETAREMRTLQTAGMNESWGLGWMIQDVPRATGPASSGIDTAARFGKSCSPATFGHYGTPGTIVWHDPETHVTCVVLTTRPVSSSRGHVLGAVSDLVAQSTA